MILVPNLRQPLNGSNVLLFLAILLLTTGCNLFRPAKGNEIGKRPNDRQENTDLDEITGKRVYDPETGTYIVVEEVPRETMDTIVFKDASISDFPPIRSDNSPTAIGGGVIRRTGVGQYGTEYLTSYNVAFMLPFVTNRFDPTSGQIDNISDWALHFYGGAKIAFDKLSEEDVKLNVSVLDTEGSPRQVSTLLRQETLQDAHLIIGPYRGDNVNMVASAIKRNNTIMVSPHFVPDNDNQSNPKYIQVKPSIKSHCEALVRHARKYFRPSQIVLVARNNPEEINALRYLQDENARLENDVYAEPFQEYIVNVDNQANLDDIDVLPFVSLGDSTAFIVPSWSSEKFVYSFLRKVDVTRAEENTVVVYGMPQWTSFERIDFEYYDNLEVHVSSSNYLNPMSAEVQAFKKSFFDRFGLVPNEEAFLGHDVALYFGRMLAKHGTKFQYFLNQDPQDLLHTRFEFGEVKISNSVQDIANLPIQKFENKYLNILKFQDFQFQPVY